MGIKLASVVLGLVAVTALSGNPTVTACLTFPLSFEAVDHQSKLNTQSSLPDTRTAEAPTRDLVAT
jgi:hypothetical protein